MFEKIIRYFDEIGKIKEKTDEDKPQNRKKQKWQKSGRKPGHKMKVAAAALMVLVAGCLAFTGCQGEKENEKKLEDLNFTVVGEKDAPQALQEMITTKKTDPFKLTYADGQDMYIVIGKGPQEGGGFSVVVKELYRTENAVVIKTELQGPEAGETPGTEPSYPVLIVKTVFCEEPVVFQ